ncbi:amidohydrolase family protein [Geomicrobium sp. JCM 19039]|uniref:amidohydrolase family protein n=1 Tax=Geomicrobium sp. JCM 19039 TaxID=1460636 RepID=UPI00045F1EBB|nr:amidohydrolase family protein [Geomicrobium sp. JCM 19039]GAK11958.1 hypothetical protein JCM19039_1684 [Geomicrobium sp. JCM 19039]
MLIKGSQILDIATGSYTLQDVRIEAGLFSEMGVLQSRVGEQVINGDGLYMIPGLMDCHCHISANYASLFLAAGITTVRNTAGNHLLLSSIREADAHEAVPRLITADRMIDGTPGSWGETSHGSLSTDDLEEAKEEVKRQVETGVDFIKVYSKITEDMLKEVIKESKRNHLDVSADLLGADSLDAKVAVEVGVRFLEHNSGIMQMLHPGWHMNASDDLYEPFLQPPNEEEIARVLQPLLARDAILVPTIGLFKQAADYPNHRVSDRFLSPSLLQVWEQTAPHVSSWRFQAIFTYTKAITRVYHRLGGTVLAGTDTPAIIFTNPGASLHRELMLLTQSGLSPYEALKSATIVPARVLNRPDLGEIKRGNRADFVLLKEDPLKHIENVSKIEIIGKGGQCYSQAELFAQAESDEKIDIDEQEFMSRWQQHLESWNVR